MAAAIALCMISFPIFSCIGQIDPIQPRSSPNFEIETNTPAFLVCISLGKASFNGRMVWVLT